MALQHHFAVVVEEDGTMFIDYDISINYDSGDTWDTAEETWVSMGTDDKVYESYQQAADKLNNLLKQTRKDNHV